VKRNRGFAGFDIPRLHSIEATGYFPSSQAPAWEFSTGSSSFLSCKARASPLGFQAGAWEPAQD